MTGRVDGVGQRASDGGVLESLEIDGRILRVSGISGGVTACAHGGDGGGGDDGDALYGPRGFVNLTFCAKEIYQHPVPHSCFGQLNHYCYCD